MLIHEIFLACVPLHSVVPSLTTAKIKTKRTKIKRKSKIIFGCLPRSAKFNVFSETKPNEAHGDQWGNGDVDITSLGAMGRCRFTVSASVGDSYVR